MPVSADEEGGARLRVRVTPRAKQNALAGLTQVDGRPALAIRLAAPPVDGAANAALVRFLAEALAIPKSAVRIVSGEASRLKTVSLSGVPPERVAEWINPAA
jgi:uncharacterized protein (TIGR00251 family)